MREPDKTQRQEVLRMHFIMKVKHTTMVVTGNNCRLSNYYVCDYAELSSLMSSLHVNP